MTYPPQQPGQGGWDQPGSNPNMPPGPPQQQPTWYGNQHAQQPAPGQPAPGQRPFQPPQQQPQFPPVPNWDGEFGQDAGGFPDVERDDKKSRAPVVLGVVAGVAVLAAGGVGAYFLFGSGSGPGDPKPVAESVVQKVNSGDLDGLDSDLCPSRKAELQSTLTKLKGAKFKVHLGQVTTKGTTASAVLTGSFSMNGATQPVNQTLGLTVEDDQWKICQLG